MSKTQQRLLTWTLTLRKTEEDQSLVWTMTERTLLLLYFCSPSSHWGGGYTLWNSVEKRCDPDMRTIPILVDTGHSQSVISCATHVGFVLLLLSSSSPVGEYVNTTFIVHWLEHKSELWRVYLWIKYQYLTLVFQIQLFFVFFFKTQLDSVVDFRQTHLVSRSLRSFTALDSRLSWGPCIASMDLRRSLWSICAVVALVLILSE